jgi:hypothetical protein
MASVKRPHLPEHGRMRKRWLGQMSGSRPEQPRANWLLLRRLFFGASAF